VETLLFPCPKPSYGIDSFPGELIWAPMGPVVDPDLEGSLGLCSTEETVPCLLLRYEAARYLIIYFHSNAEDLGRCYTFCSLLRYQFQVHVLAVEYPGYGLCPGGQASEESALENAGVAFRFVREALNWPLDGIIVLGRSIGCGPALSIAAENNIYGVILVCPFLSVQQLCRDFVGSLAELVGERFPNQERVKRVKSPLLIVHGRQDSVVPWTHSKALYDACRARKRLVVPDEMHHNTNLHSDTSIFALPMLQFFGLPDYDFTQIRVPSWAFDKRLSPFYKENNSSGASPEGEKEVEVSAGLAEEGLEASAVDAGALRSPRPSQATALDGAHGATFGPGISRKQVLAAPTPQPMATFRGAAPRAVVECRDNGGTTSDGSTATSSDLSSGSLQDKSSASGGTTLDVDKQIQEAAVGAVSRFLHARGLARAMEGSCKEERDLLRADEGEEEVVDVNFASAAPLMRSSDELPAPPEEDGFRKVPRSRSCKPALWKTMTEGTKQAAITSGSSGEASWTAVAADILRQSECWWSGDRQQSIESTDGALVPRQTANINDKLPWSL